MFLPFLITFKYEFVNCKQSKNKFVFRFSFPYTIFMCPTVSDLYNNNNNNNCLFDTTIRCSAHNCFVYTQLHTRRAEFLLTVVCLVLPYYGLTRSVKRTFLKQKVSVLAFSRTLSQPLVYVHSHTCLSLMLVVVGLYRCSMY